MNEKLYKEVCDVLYHLIDVEKITPESRLFEDLDMCSISLMELAVKCEERFNVQVDDMDMFSIKTVNDLVTYIESKKQTITSGCENG